MKKILFLSFIFILNIRVCAQDSGIEISLQQDLRLLTVGDDRGNDPVTINLISRIEVPFHDFKKSHFSAYVSAEYAGLILKNFQRYAIGAGYIVEKLSGKFGGGAYLDFGRIYREGEGGFNSFSVSGEINFKLGDRFKLVATQQLTQRKDLKMLYGSREFVISGFVGVKYRL